MLKRKKPQKPMSTLKRELQRVRDEMLSRLGLPAEILSGSDPFENELRLDKLLAASIIEASLPDAGGLKLHMGYTDAVRLWLEAQAAGSPQKLAQLPGLLATLDAYRAKLAEEYCSQIREAC